jgi:hypothetical protein
MARRVASLLGDAEGCSPSGDDAPQSELEDALVEAARGITLSPWALGQGTVDALGQAGLETDEAIFDAISVATSATVFSRIRVALRALSN